MERANFDFTIFEEKFDFFVACSIWTHASRQQIQTMHDGFVSTANTEAVLIASYIRANLFKRGYKGMKWVGRNNESDTAGIVRHSLGWIQTECANRGLVAEEIKEKAFNIDSTKEWRRPTILRLAGNLLGSPCIDTTLAIRRLVG